MCKIEILGELKSYIQYCNKVKWYKQNFSLDEKDQYSVVFHGCDLNTAEDPWLNCTYVYSYLQ